MIGEDKMKKLSCFLAIVMLIMLVGCSKLPEKNQITLQEVISTQDIDFSDRNTELSINFHYNYNNTYKNAALNFYNTLDNYAVVEIENTHSYNDEGIYISFQSFDYKVIGFEVYEDDIIEISKNHGLDIEYYKCNGIYNAIKKDVDILTAEADKYYKVNSDNFLNTYTIFDKNGNTIFKETTNESPHIYIVDENIVVSWIQSGTGVLTRSAYFYDYNTGKISNVVTGQIDWYNGYVCSVSSSAVYVQEILGSNEIKVFNSFDKQIASFIENIHSARFINDGKQIEVKYWTELENENELQTQIFDVEKPDYITTYEEL